MEGTRELLSEEAQECLRSQRHREESNVDSGFDTWQPENRAGIATGKSPELSP